jgi:hypothetical protein
MKIENPWWFVGFPMDLRSCWCKMQFIILLLLPFGRTFFFSPFNKLFFPNWMLIILK